MRCISILAPLMVVILAMFSLNALASGSTPSYQPESYFSVLDIGTTDVCASCEMEADLFHVGIDSNIASYGAGSGDITSETFPEVIATSESNIRDTFHIEDPGLRNQ